jgi:GDPmannose 4,6-dehydratase/GDP-4-dehydro-6-deoxy-D-mannose reductase
LSEPRIPRRALITGIAGSGGSYLAEYLVNSRPDVEVHGIVRWHTSDGGNLRQIAERVTVHEADLNDLGSVIAVLKAVRPDVIFHLAAHANVRTSFMTPQAVLTNNIIGTSNLFEGIRLADLDPVIHLCSTSEVYGQVDPRDVPIAEDCAMRPASPYAVSKAAQDLLGGAYWASYRLRIIRTRMFSYLNPRRADLFATSFAKQVAWIEAGLQDTELAHGNLDSVRTLLDVRDAMRAYWMAAESCEPGEVYNIGGTATMTVGEPLDRLIGLARVPIRRCCDPALLRPADVTLQIPRVDKFCRATGWTPEIPIEQSIADLLAYWRREASLAQQRGQHAH